MRDSTLRYKEQYEKRIENYNSRGMKEEPKPKGLVDRMKGKEEEETYTIENALQEVFDMIKDNNTRLLEERRK
tara:strand:+ start:1884 stop:2102 length:219 start_codon:yes stop_codon:yes gene_type:complete